MPSAPQPDWTPSDVATVVIAGVALLVSAASVVSTFLVHRLQGAVIKVEVKYHGDFRDVATYRINAPDPDKEPKRLGTSSLREASALLERFPAEKFYPTTFLRVIVTNTGRTDAKVDSITYFNAADQGIAIHQKQDPPYPVDVAAQTYMTRDYLYSELLSHAGEQSRVQFVVQLSNGTKVKSGWVKLSADLSKPT